MTANEDIKTLIKSYQERIETALDHWLPEAKSEPLHLHEAMRYAVLGNGKRIRPILVYASGRAFGVPCEELDGPATAIEMIHAYSLVHDDLPAMDDDDLRRGKPTCHKAFDEATAILAGDALQALAFHVLAHDTRIRVSAEQRLRMIDILAVASGSVGMAGGQAIDLAAVGKQLNLQQLENMHMHKTGALIRSCVELGALSFQGVEQRRMDQFADYARCIGLAFQIRDDILDIEGDTEVIGKTQGSDIARNKPTYPNLLGLDGAHKAAQDLHRHALTSIADFDERADVLRWLADYVITREK
ncbi:MAG: (2E,6E)-farnesyl diphosphate synthase [Gammaproteobacteria bacterium]|jgi:geranylgeranyl diphosphate synthase type II|nr:MAG: (2E,6E)-farnesyl diphosphate synthase [Gammaproteobacteria bacterium]